MAGLTLAEALYAEHHQFVRAIVRNHAPWPECEDIEQVVWLRVTRAIRDGRFNGQSPHGWLATIATRCCIDAARNRWRRVHELGDWVPGAPDVQTVDPAIATAVSALREPWRRAVLLAAVGYGSAEAAALMGLREVTYRVYLYRGRQHLRKQLEVA